MEKQHNSTFHSDAISTSQESKMSAYIQIPLLRETAQKRPLAQEKEPNLFSHIISILIFGKQTAVNSTSEYRYEAYGYFQQWLAPDPSRPAICREPLTPTHHQITQQCKSGTLIGRDNFSAALLCGITRRKRGGKNDFQNVSVPFVLTDIHLACSLIKPSWGQGDCYATF